MNNNSNKETIKTKIIVNDLFSLNKKKENKKTKFTFIDLFAGIGGIRLGFESVGGDCVFTSEWDGPAQKTYQANFNEIPYGDITKITPEEIPNFDMLVAGFPCQPFSQAGLKKGFEDTRGTLFFDVARIIKYHKPSVVFLENVRNLAGHDKGNTLKVILGTLEELGYKVFNSILNAKDFGLPQNRARIYIIGFKDDVNFIFPKPPMTKTRVWDILDKQVDNKYQISDKLWAGHQRRKKEHRERGNGFGYSIFDDKSEYTSTISARYYKDGLEILIKQNGRNPRKLTPREASRLQGYPKNFVIPVSDNQAYKQFGNSVAVPVIKALAKQIMITLDKLPRNSIKKMKINKIEIKKSKLDSNFKLYLFLKELNGSNKLTENELNHFLEVYFANIKLNTKKISDIFLNLLDSLSDKKKEKIGALLYQIKDNVDFNIFIFSLKLIQIKKLLLEEAKLTEITELVTLSNVNQLSLEYDTISKSKPYYTRVNGALLSLLFFSKLEQKDTGFISQSTDEYITSLFGEYEYLKGKGLEANQMFMLMFSESIDQSIISDAGSSYEDRIYNILIGLGIKAESIKKIHDANDSSTEYDFFFELDKKTFGISAKRTLRERYKQFIKTKQTTGIDVTIEITLGLDLSEEKAKSIRQHGVFLFVADEIYKSRKYLQEMQGIFPASLLNIKTLKSLV